MKIAVLILIIILSACNTNSPKLGEEVKRFVFDTDSCKSSGNMEYCEVDSLSIYFLKPNFISILDTPYVMSRDIAYLSRKVDSTKTNMVTIKFVKQNFYEPSITDLLQTTAVSAVEMASKREINFHLNDSFLVARDLRCGLLVYDYINDRQDKYYHGNFIFQRPDSILISIRIALKDNKYCNSLEQVMCMMRSISFKDSTVLLPIIGNDRFSNVPFFGQH